MADMNGTTGTPTILVPIRYPLTAESIRTLEHASHVSEAHGDGQLLVLHVDLLQCDEHSTAQDIQRAIAPIVGDQPVNVIIRRGFLVEEVIREEAEQRGAEIIIIGQNQMAKWRRYINRLFGNHPDIASYLRDHTNATIETTG